MPKRIPGTNRWILDDDDVVRGANIQPLYDSSTFVAEELQNAQYERHQTEYSRYQTGVYKIFRGGISCKLHTVTKNPGKWVSGELRYVLEFEPEDLSDLDNTNNEMLDIEADVVESNSLQLPEASQALEEIRQLGSQ